MSHDALQLTLGAVGLVVLACLFRGRKVAAAAVGLAAQPAWWLFFYRTDAWALALLSVAYSALYAWEIARALRGRE